MDGRHESLFDLKCVVDTLDHRCETIGGTGCARHVGHVRGVLVLVDTYILQGF